VRGRYVALGKAAGPAGAAPAPGAAAPKKGSK